jgi:hypothetical protein
MRGLFLVGQCAQSLPATSILANMTPAEAIETTPIHRIAGLTGGPMVLTAI